MIYFAFAVFLLIFLFCVGAEDGLPVVGLMAMAAFAYMYITASSHKPLKPAPPLCCQLQPLSV
jgi:hypothetical protein